MARAPLVLLLAAAAPAAAGLWEEVGRNTDVTASAAADSRLLRPGRAPDVGPVATLGAEAVLSIPGSAFNLVASAQASRSLDGAPRLDQRAAGLALRRFGASHLAELGVTLEHNLGANPAALARSFGETTFHAQVAWIWDKAELPPSLTLAAQSTPRREEAVLELMLNQPLAAWEDRGIEAFLSAGTLRATDADGDGRGRVEGWSFGGVGLMAEWMPSPGTRLYMKADAQAATEAPGRMEGRVSLGWERTF